METILVYWVYIGIMEKNMETTIVYWGYIGRMEKNMETIIMGYIGYILYSPKIYEAPKTCFAYAHRASRTLGDND